MICLGGYTFVSLPFFLFPMPLSSASLLWQQRFAPLLCILWSLCMLHPLFGFWGLSLQPTVFFSVDIACMKVHGGWGKLLLLVGGYTNASHPFLLLPSSLLDIIKLGLWVGQGEGLVYMMGGYTNASLPLFLIPFSLCLSPRLRQVCPLDLFPL